MPQWDATKGEYVDNGSSMFSGGPSDGMEADTSTDAWKRGKSTSDSDTRSFIDRAKGWYDQEKAEYEANQGTTVTGGVGGGAAHNNEALNMDQLALSQITGLNLPTLEQLQLGESHLGGAYADEGALAMQRSAADEIAGIIRHEGMTPQDVARMEEISAMNRGNQQAIAGNMAARGMGGSGVEAMQRMLAQQGAASQSVGVQADAAERVRDAIGMQAQLGGQMRGQSFAEEATRRGAKDERDRFNSNRVQDEFLNRTMKATTLADLYSGRGAREHALAAQEDAQARQTVATIVEGSGRVIGSVAGPVGSEIGGRAGSAGAQYVDTGGRQRRVRDD